MMNTEDTQKIDRELERKDNSAAAWEEAEEGVEQEDVNDDALEEASAIQSSTKVASRS